MPVDATVLWKVEGNGETFEAHSVVRAIRTRFLPRLRSRAYGNGGEPRWTTKACA